MVQIASPQSSDTVYTALATFTQMFGEDKAYEYLKKLHNNVGHQIRFRSASVKDTDFCISSSE